MLKELSKNKPSYYVHLVIMVAIMLGIQQIPPAEPLTEVGMKILGIFCGALYGWLLCDLVWPSLIALIMLGVSGYDSMNNVLAAGLGNSTVIMIMLFCAVTSILSSAGVAEFIAHKMIAAKFIEGKPWLLSLMLCLVMIILNLLLSAMAAVLVMFPLVVEISKLYGFKPGDKWPILIILGTHYIGSMAYQLFPFKAGPALVFGTYQQLSGVETINYAIYMFLVALIVIATTAVVLLFGKYVVKPDVSPILQNKVSMNFDEKLNSYQKFVLVSFLVLLVAMLWPNVAPAGWGITKVLKAITTNGLLMLYIAVYLFFNFKDGIGFKTIMTKEVAWPAIYLVVAALSLANAFRAESTGITPWIGQVVEPIMSGHNPMIFVFLLILFSTILTNIANNTGTLALFTPIAYTIAISVGSVTFEPLMLCILLSGCLGIVTPPASSSIAYLFGQKDWLPGGMIMKYGIIFSIFNMIIITLIGYGLGSIIW